MAYDYLIDDLENFVSDTFFVPSWVELRECEFDETNFFMMFYIDSQGKCQIDKEAYEILKGVKFNSRVNDLH